MLAFVFFGEIILYISVRKQSNRTYRRGLRYFLDFFVCDDDNKLIIIFYLYYYVLLLVFYLLIIIIFISLLCRLWERVVV